MSWVPVLFSDVWKVFDPKILLDSAMRSHILNASSSEMKIGCINRQASQMEPGIDLGAGFQGHRGRTQGPVMVSWHCGP